MEVRKIPLGLKDQEVFSVFPEACCFVRVSPSLGVFFSEEPKERDLQLAFALKKVVESFKKREKPIPFSFSFLKETEKGKFVISVSFTEKEEKTTKYPFLKDALSVLVEDEVKEGIFLFLVYGEELYETIKEVVEKFEEKTKKKITLKKVRIQSFKREEVRQILVRKKTLKDVLKEFVEKGRKTVRRFGKKGVFLSLLLVVGVGIYLLLTKGVGLINFKGEKKVERLPVKKVNWKRKNEEFLSEIKALYEKGIVEASGEVSYRSEVITYYSFSPCPFGKEKEKIGSLRKCFYLLKGKLKRKEGKVRGKYIVKEEGTTVFLIGEGNETLSVPSKPIRVRLVEGYLFLNEVSVKPPKKVVKREKESGNKRAGVFKQS